MVKVRRNLPREVGSFLNMTAVMCAIAHGIFGKWFTLIPCAVCLITIIGLSAIHRGVFSLLDIDMGKSKSVDLGPALLATLLAMVVNSRMMPDEKGSDLRFFGLILSFGVVVSVVLCLRVVPFCEGKVGRLLGVIFGMCIGVLLVMQINTMMEFSEPETMTAQVIDKTVEVESYADFFPAFLVQVESGDGWNGEFEVGFMEYLRIRTGDEIEVYHYPGALGVPYYVVEPSQ